MTPHPYIVDVEKWKAESEVHRSEIPTRGIPQAFSFRKPSGFSPYAMTHIPFMLSRRSRTVNKPK